MKYTWYQFLVQWIVSAIFLLIAYYFLDWNIKLLFGLLFLKIGLDTSNESTKIKDE